MAQQQSIAVPSSGAYCAGNTRGCQSHFAGPVQPESGPSDLAVFVAGIHYPDDTDVGPGRTRPGRRAEAGVFIKEIQSDLRTSGEPRLSKDTWACSTLPAFSGSTG